MAWYVIHSKPKQETVARDNLLRQGYVAYCPQITLKRRLRGAWRALTEPLFPRYLFVQLVEGEDSFAPIRSTVGVGNLLRFGNKPAIISSHSIAEMQARENQEQPLSGDIVPWKKGDKVHIIDGALAGLNAVFQTPCDQQRVYVLLELLGKQNRIKIKSSCLA